MTNQHEVLICGGGVIGLASAYFLAKRGVRALIVEADGVASGASGAAAGLLTPPTLAQLVEPQGPLRRRGFAMHLEMAETLREEAGVDFSFGRCGMLAVALTGEEAAEQQRVVAEETEAGIASRLLTAAEAGDRCGWIDQPIAGAVEREAIAKLDPYQYSLALLTAAERLGARLRSGRVRGVERAGGRVTGVRLDDESIEAAAVLFAMGPWSGALGDWLGTSVPVEPLKGEILRVRPRGPLPDAGFKVWGSSGYAAPKASGLAYLGTTEERAGFDRQPSEPARDAILRSTLRASMALGEGELIEQTACLRPLSADGLPIMGAVPGVEGAFVATGHGRQGVLMALASGEAIAELMLDGRSRSLDLAPFAPGRFAR